MCRFIQSFRSTIYTDCRTKRIHITDLMSHDHNLIFSHNDLLQSMGLNTRFNTRPFLNLFCLTAIIRNLITGLYDSLITAASQSKVNRILGPRIRLSIGNSIHSHTDAQCNRHFITNVDLTHLIQNGKPAGLNG